MTFVRPFPFRPTAIAAALSAILAMAVPSAIAQEAAPPEVTLDQQRDLAMQACLDAGTAADECDCGMAYLRANLNDDDEGFVLEILANLSTLEPAAFAESKGMTETELNAEILRLQPTLTELGSQCG